MSLKSIQTIPEGLKKKKKRNRNDREVNIKKHKLALLLHNRISSQQQAGQGLVLKSPPTTQVILSALLVVLFKNFQYTEW